MELFVPWNSRIVLYSLLQMVFSPIHLEQRGSNDHRSLCDLDDSHEESYIWCTLPLFCNGEYNVCTLCSLHSHKKRFHSFETFLFYICVPFRIYFCNLLSFLLHEQSFRQIKEGLNPNDHQMLELVNFVFFFLRICY